MNQKDYFAIVILLTLCCIMILLLNHGYNKTFDDRLYVDYAQQMINGTFNVLQSPYSYGWLLPLSVYLSLDIFNSTSLPSILEYISLIILVYLITSRINTSKLIGFSTALIALTSAFIAGYIGRVLPDMLTGVIIALAIYLSLDNKRRSWFFTGLIFGLVIFVKLSTAAFAIPLFLALLWYKKPALPFIIGFLITALMYMVTMGFNTSIFQTYQANQIKLDAATIYANFLAAMVFILPVVWLSNGLLIQGVYTQSYGLGLLMDLAILGIYLAYLKKDKAYAVWAAWLGISFIYMLFGSESLSYYEPLTVVSRYFISLAVPMAILCTYSLKLIYEATRRRYSQTQAYIILASIVIIAVIAQVPMLWYFHTVITTYYGAPT